MVTVDGGKRMGIHFENHSRGLVVLFALALLGLMATAPMVLSANNQKCQARLNGDTAQAQIKCDADAPVSDEATKTDAY